MAALVEGQQYGLSSHDSNSINKTLIFVKLTDSALKSIEEFVRNKSNSILKPSIQFDTNNGVIRLPNKETHTKSYGFTLSNVETDGLQGSFECLQQSGSKSLESLGCMLLKMHINANEDSYEKTRVKMAAVEKENKKFCTKEIKPSGSYVGRKVKVKRPLSSILSKPGSPPSAIQAPLKVAPKVFASESNAAPNSERYGLSNKNAKNPDIMKQSCRDRVIHLLALRSYKKPELIAKLYSEGMKEKERRGITAILTQVAVSKGNSFTLAPFAWNEVQDSWKFYTQEEAETVRTRKNEFYRSSHENGVTTPSGSPDQSPTQKRALDELENSHHDQRSKKQRISHFNRVDPVVTNSESLRPIREDSHFVPVSDKNEYSEGKKDIHPTEHRTNINTISQVNNLSWKHITNTSTPISNMADRNGQRDCSISINEKLSPNRTIHMYPKSNLSNGDSKSEVHQDSSVSREIENRKLKSDSNKGYSVVGETGKYAINSHRKYVNSEPEKANHSSKTSETSLRPPEYQNPQWSPDSNKRLSNGHHHNGLPALQIDSSDLCVQNSVPSENGQLSPNSSSRDSMDSVDFLENGMLENTEYLKEFVEITSRDQRARYKAAFNAEYEEYKTLHDKVRSIVNKFSLLENKLNECETGTNEYLKIKARICKEYLCNQSDPSYQAAKKKLAFLHSKLSHIKRLVMDYDRAYTACKS